MHAMWPPVQVCTSAPSTVPSQGAQTPTEITALKRRQERRHSTNQTTHQPQQNTALTRCTSCPAGSGARSAGQPPHAHAVWCCSPRRCRHVSHGTQQTKTRGAKSNETKRGTGGGGGHLRPQLGCVPVLLWGDIKEGVRKQARVRESSAEAQGRPKEVASICRVRSPGAASHAFPTRDHHHLVDLLGE